MAKKKHKLSFRTVLWVLTVVLVGWVVYQNWADIVETIQYIDEANIWVLLLLIPEQLMMYYACGQIFFSYLRYQRGVRQLRKREMLEISTELNFVNHAIPGGGVGGLAFLTYRLKEFGVSAGQASFLYVFRYAMTTVINYLQALVAVAILWAFKMIPAEAYWLIGVALLMNMAVMGFLWLVVYIASSKKRISFFARTMSRIVNGLVRVLTFGHKRKILGDDQVERYFGDIHENVKIARENKRYLKKPAMWGLIYSLLEVGTYYIVALSLGRPELLPFIMVGEAIGSVFDGIVPYGLYELGMAGVMIALGVDFPTATIITVMTRVITLVFTIVSGAIPYSRAMRGQKHDQ